MESPAGMRLLSEPKAIQKENSDASEFVLAVVDRRERADVDAQESPSQTPVEKVAPFVDVLTRGVIHIDLRRAEVGSLMDLAIPIVPQAFFYEASFRAEFKQMQAALQAIGIEEVFVVLSLAELPQQLWFAIAPCPDDLDSKKLASQLPADLPERLGATQSLTVECLDTGDSDHVLFIGIEDTLTRLKHGQVTHRPELEAAFAAIGTGLRTPMACNFTSIFLISSSRISSASGLCRVFGHKATTRGQRPRRWAITLYRSFSLEGCNDFGKPPIVLRLNREFRRVHVTVVGDHDAPPIAA